MVLEITLCKKSVWFHLITKLGKRSSLMVLTRKSINITKEIFAALQLILCLSTLLESTKILLKNFRLKLIIAYVIYCLIFTYSPILYCKQSTHSTLCHTHQLWVSLKSMWWVVKSLLLLPCSPGVIPLINRL